MTSPYLASDIHWPLKDSVHAKDGWLGRVDDGRTEHGAEHAAVTDSERPPVHVLHGQVTTTSLQ